MSVSEILPYPAKRFPYRPQYLKMLQQKINAFWTKLGGPPGVACFGLNGIFIESQVENF
jgi:hypothetical protein